MSSVVTVAAGVAAFAALASPPATAADFGFRGGYYAEAGRPFLGAEVVFPVGERAHVAPGLEVLDVPDGHFVNVSVDALYDLDCACKSASRVWAGAGLALVSQDDGSGSALKPGLDLLLGFGIRLGGLLPYTQVKAILKDRPEVSIGVGLRF